MQRTILCYGDSNTWGYVPVASKNVTLPLQRFPRDIRWTGLLQKKLGENYYVIEEGLNGRTTNLDHPIAPDRNGKTYLPSCLYSHAPIDLIILALGGNDLKTYFNREAEDIRDGLSELIDLIQGTKYGTEIKVPPKILVLSLPIPPQQAEKYIDENGIEIFKGAIKKAKKLINLYDDLAKQKQCDFLACHDHLQLSEIDGLHLDEVGHRKVANLILEKVKNIFNNL